MNWIDIRVIFDIFATGGLIIAGLIYWKSQSTKAKNIAEKDLNETLNELLEARDKKIKDLEELTQEQGKEMIRLKEALEVISAKKTDIEGLVLLALKDYFSSHPEIADAVYVKERAEKVKNI